MKHAIRSLHRFLFSASAFAVLSAASLGCIAQSANPAAASSAATNIKAAVISVPEAYERAQQPGVMLIDIREPQEWAGGVAANEKGEQIAKLLPMSQLAKRMDEIPNDPSQAIVLICRTQNRSSSVAQTLINRGYTNITYVQGGMKEWAERKLPSSAPNAATIPNKISHN